MTTEAQVAPLPPPAPLLGPVLGSLPDLVFQQEVLQRLGPRALASLAQASHGCAAAVAATALMQWATRAKTTAARRLGYPLPPLCLKEACSHAAGGGDREMLEWLHSTGCPWDTMTCWMAARGGHLDLVKWLHNHSCPWNWLTPAWDAKGGHLAVLQWARAHYCPCDSAVCIYAAMDGQLEVLQWVRENDADGEVWNVADVRRFAAGPRKQAVLKWLASLSAP